MVSFWYSLVKKIYIILFHFCINLCIFGLKTYYINRGSQPQIVNKSYDLFFLYLFNYWSINNMNSGSQPYILNKLNACSFTDIHVCNNWCILVWKIFSANIMSSNFQTRFFLYFAFSKKSIEEKLFQQKIQKYSFTIEF